MTGALDAHMATARNSPANTVRVVTFDSSFVVPVASFPFEGHTEVTYWITRWGQGTASRALFSVTG